MTDTQHILNQPINGKPVYKRTFTKADGRDLFLYGYAPHNETPINETADDLANGGELRWHPLRQEWNIYAAHRQNRTFKPAAAANPLAPSLPGSAPTEIPFSSFELAVFENKFTSLHFASKVGSTTPPVEQAPALGQCEVIVYTSNDSGNLHSIGQERRRLLVRTWIDRYSALFKKGCQFVLPFENRGAEVGVTLPHPHGQIYGFQTIPTVQAKSAAAFDEGYDLTANLSAMQESYVVAETGNVTAFCPPFSRFPLEVWIAPNRQVPGPWAFSEEELDAFAALLGDITRRYDNYFERETAYMLSLHASPLGHEDKFHFTAQFYPILRAPGRVKYLASVEQATGMFTVDVMPENAADILRGFGDVR